MGFTTSLYQPNEWESDIFCGDMGVSIVMGVPTNGWFLLGKILVKWMMTGGSPISGNQHFWVIQQSEY